MAKRYASGKHAVAICQRSAKKIPYRRLVKEPGTGFLVDKRWSDGKWNLVDHPRNFLPKDLSDATGLKYSTGNDNPDELIHIKTAAGIIVKHRPSSVTCVNLLDEQGRVLLNETSVTVTECFNRLFWNSYRVV